MIDQEIITSTSTGMTLDDELAVNNSCCLSHDNKTNLKNFVKLNEKFNTKNFITHENVNVNNYDSDHS